MTNVIYFVAAVPVIPCERQMHFFLTHNHAFYLYQNYQFTPDYPRNKQTIAQLKVAIFTGV